MSKSRYYLEQTVPELEDLKRKGLFDKPELTMIMRRRTDFEHRIGLRGSRVRDFLRYAEFENNLEQLRKKRWTRLSKAGELDTKPLVLDWAGPRRILFVYERATNRFPGEMAIWSAYLRYARAQGAVKVVYKAYTRLLQLQPTNVDAWISAGKYEFEDHANALGARTLLQRGLRFNPDAVELWLAYAQLELAYVCKLLQRRAVLGLLTEQQQRAAEKQAAAEDELTLPSVISAGDLNDELTKLPDADMNMLGNPDTNPALRGQVALTIYDVCVQLVLRAQPQDEFGGDRVAKASLDVLRRFLELFDRFDDLDRGFLCGHVVSLFQQRFPGSVEGMVWDTTLPVRHVAWDGAEFVAALQQTVNKAKAYRGKGAPAGFREAVVGYLTERFLASAGPEGKVRALVEGIIQRM